MTMPLSAILLGSVLQFGSMLHVSGWEIARNWQELSPDERERAEKGRQKYQQLPDGERERFERNREKWQQLSPEQQQDLRDRFKERRGHGLLGE